MCSERLIYNFVDILFANLDRRCALHILFPILLFTYVLQALTKRDPPPKLAVAHAQLFYCIRADGARNFHGATPSRSSVAEDECMPPRCETHLSVLGHLQRKNLAYKRPSKPSVRTISNNFFESGTNGIAIGVSARRHFPPKRDSPAHSETVGQSGNPLS